MSSIRIKIDFKLQYTCTFITIFTLKVKMMSFFSNQLTPNAFSGVKPYSGSNVENPSTTDYLSSYDNDVLNGDVTHYELLRTTNSNQNRVSLCNVIDVYRNYEYFDTLDQSKSGMDLTSVLFDTVNPAHRNNVHSIVDFDTFNTRFNKITHGMLNFFDWNNVVVMGGSVQMALSHMPIAEVEKESFDVDVMVYGLTESQAKKKFNEIYESVRDIATDHKCVKTRNSITVVFAKPYRHLQFVLKLYDSIEDMLNSPDLQSAMCCYNGERVFTNSDGHFGLVNSTNIYKPKCDSSGYEGRVYKYTKRGFKLFVPGFDKTRTTNHIYKNCLNSKDNEYSDHVATLVRLLHTEKFGKGFSELNESNEYYLNSSGAKKKPGLYTNMFFKDSTNVNDVVDNLAVSSARLLRSLKLKQGSLTTIEQSLGFMVHDVAKFPVYKVFSNVKLALIDENEYDPSLEDKPFFMNGPTFRRTVITQLIADCFSSPKARKDAQDEFMEYIGRHTIDKLEYSDIYYSKQVEELIANVEANTDTVDSTYLSKFTVKQLEARDRYGGTLMKACIDVNNTVLVRKLVDMGYNFFERLDEGMTTMHYAVMRNNYEVVRIMLTKCEAEEAIANIRLYDNNMCNVIHYAIMYADLSMFILLHEALHVKYGDISWNMKRPKIKESVSREDSREYSRGDRRTQKQKGFGRSRHRGGYRQRSQPVDDSWDDSWDDSAQRSRHRGGYRQRSQPVDDSWDDSWDDSAQRSRRERAPNDVTAHDPVRRQKYICSAKMCMMYDQLEIMKYLLTKYSGSNDFGYFFVDSNINIVDTSDILRYAISTNNFKALEILLEFFGNKYSQIDVALDVSDLGKLTGQIELVYSEKTDNVLNVITLLEKFTSEHRLTECHTVLCDGIVTALTSMFHDMKYTKMLNYIELNVPDAWTSRDFKALHDNISFVNIFQNKYMDVEKALRMYSYVNDSKWDELTLLARELQYNFYVYDNENNRTVLSLCKDDPIKMSGLLKVMDELVYSKTRTATQTINNLIDIDDSIVNNVDVVKVMLANEKHGKYVKKYFDKNAHKTICHLWNEACNGKYMTRDGKYSVEYMYDFTKLTEFLVLMTNTKCNVNTSRLDIIETGGYSRSSLLKKHTCVKTRFELPVNESNLLTYFDDIESVKDKLSVPLREFFCKENFDTTQIFYFINSEKAFDSFMKLYPEFHKKNFLISQEFKFIGHHTGKGKWSAKILDMYYDDYENCENAKKFNFLAVYNSQFFYNYLKDKGLLVKHLMKLDFNVHYANIIKHTVLFPEILKVKDCNGNTLLHAVAKRNPKLFLKESWDLLKFHNVKNDYGKTVMDYLETCVNDVVKYSDKELAVMHKVYCKVRDLCK